MVYKQMESSKKKKQKDFILAILIHIARQQYKKRLFFSVKIKNLFLEIEMKSKT